MREPKRLRFAAAQLGPKPGKAHALSLLLVPADLPGDGWRAVDERVWRTGTTNPDLDWARRAREAKTLTAWRSFEQASPNRWLWTEAITCASAEDAAAALRDVPHLMLRNLRANVTVTSEGDVGGHSIAGINNQWIYEQLTTGPDGDNAVRYVGGTEGLIVFVSAFSSTGRSGWSWDDIDGVVESQALRVRQQTGSAP